MSKDDVNDYEKLKAALLKRYQLTADGFRKRFRTSYPGQGESPVQFITRLENYLVRWIELAGDNKSYDGIKKLFVEEQHLRSCPKEMSMHLREGKPAMLKDLEERAETYLEAHSADVVFGIDLKFPKMQGPFQSRQCHKCGSFGNLRQQCPISSPKSSPKRPSAPQYPSQRPSPPVPAPRQTTYGESRPTPFQRGPIRCYNCNRSGHITRDCRARSTAAMEFQKYSDHHPQQRYQQYPGYSQKTDDYPYQQETSPAAVHPYRSAYGSRPPYSTHPVQSVPTTNTVPSVSTPKSPTTTGFRPPASSNVSDASRPCRQHNVVDCDECLGPVTQTHHRQALVAVCQDCGQQHPVIVDVCQSSCTNVNKPVSDGLLEKQPVKVLRDSGCSTVVVRQSLVPEDKLTGQEERCILIDGTMRRTPVAEIFIDTPYYIGMTTAVCMNNAVYDLIIGNVPGSTGLSFTSSRNRRRRYNSRQPWFFHKRKKDQAFREL